MYSVLSEALGSLSNWGGGGDASSPIQIWTTTGSSSTTTTTAGAVGSGVTLGQTVPSGVIKPLVRLNHPHRVPMGPALRFRHSAFVRGEHHR